MSLRSRWFSRAEDRVEAWLTRHHQERVLAGETKPVGPCPDESFLQSLARHSNQIELQTQEWDMRRTVPFV